MVRWSWTSLVRPGLTGPWELTVRWSHQDDHDRGHLNGPKASENGQRGRFPLDRWFSCDVVRKH